ncbi:MAG TPA: alpha/beta fold hydrolase [Candidatus Binatia bacterium]|nr:alpha/beta fold hydrolase [Candidatus Binatia bacterium]
MANEIISIRADDGTSLAVGAYTARHSDAVALLVHGLASHMGWYHGIAEALQEERVAVYMPDRRGVALSGGTPGHTDKWTTLVQDLVRVAEEVERRHPGQPMHAIGISLGGVITLASSILHPGLFGSQILLSPALVASVSFPPLRRLEIFWQAFFAPRKLYDLPFGVKDLTDNQSWQTALFEETKANQASARFLLETLRLQRFVRKEIRHVDLPMLALFGERDLVVDNKAAIDILDKAGSPCVRVEVFASLSHILAASMPKQELIGRLLLWLRGNRGSAQERFSLLKTLLVKREDHVVFNPPANRTDAS